MKKTPMTGTGKVIDEFILILNIAELSLDFKQESIYQSICLSANFAFSLLCVPLIKSESLN
jgi:hypothetical protein